MPEQPAQGSTATYCSAWPSDMPERNNHYLVTHMCGGALVSVQRCQFCGWIDFGDLDEQVRALIAEGLRQATEGWYREWAVDWPDTLVPYAADDEADARHFAGYRDDRTVVSRLVGPWEPADTSADSEGADRD